MREAISSVAFSVITRQNIMPFASKQQVKYLFAKHPGIARRWLKKYGLNYKSLPRRKKKAARKKLVAALDAAEAMVYGQPGSPSPLKRTFDADIDVDAAAAQAAKQPTRRNKRMMKEKVKLMRRVAKLTKYRLQKMGFLKNVKKAERKRLGIAISASAAFRLAGSH